MTPPSLRLLIMAMLFLLPAGDLLADTCDGTSPGVQFDTRPGSNPGELIVGILWRYQGPGACKDAYNVRWGIIGRGEDQVELGGGECPRRHEPLQPCRYELPISSDKPYAFKVQACDQRFLQPSSCSQWGEAFLLPYGPHTCKDGFTWREAFPNDRVCVTQSTKNQVALDNSQADARRAPGEFGPDTCRQGFVWRGAFPGDRVCVLPSTRDQVARENRDAGARTSPLTHGPHGPLACRQGFVWREAGPNDFVCVTPEARAQAAADNQLAASRRGNETCRQGFVWREAGPNDLVCVTPEVRQQTRNDNAQAQARRARP